MDNLSKMDYVLGLYITLYIGIPANGIDQILGFNLHIIILLIAILVYQGTKEHKPLQTMTKGYLGFQLFSTFMCLIVSYKFSDFNMYGTLVNFIQFIPFIFLVCEVPKPNTLCFFLFSFVCGAMLEALLCLCGQYLGLTVIEYGGMFDDRITIMGRDGNEMAMIMNIAAAMALYLIRIRYHVLINIIAIASSMYAILITGSRTGLIGMIILILVNFILNQKGFSKKIQYIFISLFMLFGAYYALTHFVTDSIVERFLNIGEEIEEGTMASRRLIWDDCLKTYSNSGLFYQLIGHGYNTTKLYTFNQHDAHNVFLKILIEFGLLGTIALLKYLLFYVSGIFKINDLDVKFLIGSVFTVVLISFMTLSWIYNIIIWIVFILLHQAIKFNKQ